MKPILHHDRVIFRDLINAFHAKYQNHKILSLFLYVVVFIEFFWINILKESLSQ